MPNIETLTMPARIFGSGSTKEVDVLQSTRRNIGIKWEDLNDEASEASICSLGAELDAMLPGPCLSEEKFMEQLSNRVYKLKLSTGEQQPRNFMQDLIDVLEVVAARIGFRFIGFDVYWMWKFVAAYVEAILATKAGEFDHYLVSSTIAKTFNIEYLRARFMRPDILWLKSLFLEYYVGAHRGEVEIRLLQMALSGNATAINMYRSGHNIKRSIKRSEIKATAVFEDVTRMGASELTEFVKHLRKQVSESDPIDVESVAVVPKAEADDGIESE